MGSALWDLEAAFVAHRARDLADLPDLADARAPRAGSSRPGDLDPGVLASALGRTVGDGEDLRALTPWLLREVVAGRVDLGIALERIHAFWGSWTAPQRDAVRDVVSALWRGLLDRHPGAGPSALRFLGVVSLLGDPPARLLAVWEYRDLPAADHHLAALLVEAWGGARIDPVVLAWALDVPRRTRLRRALARDRREPWAQDLAAAVVLLPA